MTHKNLSYSSSLSRRNTVTFSSQNVCYHHWTRLPPLHLHFSISFTPADSFFYYIFFFLLSLSGKIQRLLFYSLVTTSFSAFVSKQKILIRFFFQIQRLEVGINNRSTKVQRVSFAFAKSITLFVLLLLWPLLYLDLNLIGSKLCSPINSSALVLLSQGYFIGNKLRFERLHQVCCCLLFSEEGVGFKWRWIWIKFCVFQGNAMINLIWYYLAIIGLHYPLSGPENGLQKKWPQLQHYMNLA